MKQVCLLCERTSLDHNLYCQETFCPAEMSPTILDFGEWLGDIEIVKPVIVLRSAVLYEAIHQKETVFLKVAHPGLENTERLKREALFLRDNRHKHLPALLPPYANTSVKQDAYGRTMLREHLLYFFLFEYVEGEPLRDILTKNPQLWISHIGWILTDLALTINRLHLRGLYHYALCPSSLLVRFDDTLNAPRILLFDLGIASDQKSIGTDWYAFSVLPAYTAPELLSGQPIRPDYRTDVYGLGMILYEMLVGKPAFPYRLQRDEDVYAAVRANHRVRMNRLEDVKSVADVALRAVDPQLARRQATAADFAESLRDYFGRAPEEKSNRLLSLTTIMTVIGVLLAVAFLITLAITLSRFIT